MNAAIRRRLRRAAAVPEAVKSDVVTKVTGGSKLHLKVLETIYHPGHYRGACRELIAPSCRPIPSRSSA